MRRGSRLGIAITAALIFHGAGRAADPEQTIRGVKDLERSLGFKPTGNFARSDTRVPAYYRCYFTGKLNLPESYDKLELREGTKDGCSIDGRKYDVFYYPIEAVASGHTPVTSTLASAAPERLATVVAHEDFHQQIEGVPDRIAEAAATLVGFVTAAAAGSGDPADAGLFLEKAGIVNRYFDQLSRAYRNAHTGRSTKERSFEEKHRILAGLYQTCNSIQPEPRSFNKCPGAANNAGLSFDHSYTKYYPLVYRIFQACQNDLRSTIEVLVHAPKKRSEAETVRYFETVIQAKSR